VRARGEHIVSVSQVRRGQLVTGRR